MNGIDENVMNFDDEIINVIDIQRHYIDRDGFVFVPVTAPAKIFDGISVRIPCDGLKTSSYPPPSLHTLEEHIQFINKYQIKKANVKGNDLSFVQKCPSLQYLNIIPEYVGNDFDYSPLYNSGPWKGLCCQTVYGSRSQYHTTVDYSKIDGLERVDVISEGAVNWQTIPTLRTLSLYGVSAISPGEMFCSKQLDSLLVTASTVRTLEGIGNSSMMQCISLNYDRRLTDISALVEVRDSLKGLKLECCSKLKDLSVLKELVNLEYLELHLSCTVPDLSFLKCMTKLKVFVFSIDVADGDLFPCMNVPYVYCERNRNHFNLKDKDLPKSLSKLPHGDENIDIWRRIW